MSDLQTLCALLSAFVVSPQLQAIEGLSQAR